jgi:hypothetical protein
VAVLASLLVPVVTGCAILGGGQVPPAGSEAQPTLAPPVATPRPAAASPRAATPSSGAAIAASTATPAEASGSPGCPQTTAKTVVVANTDGQGAYLRASPRMDDRLTAHPDDTELQVRGPALEGEGHCWLPVTAPDGQEGWIPLEYTSAASASSAGATPEGQ